ncbi:MAG: hypothetical protein MOGMAGMI_01454 [Candidatus Omnitrophica bacterium]|nr:hypothetical protein [Candidatus Omnitrophota bacterium]
MVNARKTVPGTLNQGLREKLFYIFSRLPTRISTVARPFLEALAGRDKPYFFETRILDQRMVMGGWVGVSGYMVQARLDGSDAETYRVYAHVLSPNERGVILDIGSNFGQSLLVFKALAPDAPVYCFEPIHRAADFLEQLFRRNAFTDCRLGRAALGDGSVDKVSLAYGVGASDIASYAMGQPQHTLTQEAPSMTLDRYLEDHPVERIALIKIDVEGAEPEVISGALATIRRHKPPIVMEVLAQSDPKGGVSDKTRRMEKTLRELGYTWHWIAACGKLVAQDPIAPDPVWWYKNYLLLPAETTAR